MSASSIHATFIKGATKPEEFPTERTPEIALLGRSNVGKSTLINTVTNLKHLAKVSSTPGKTREINFFNIKVKNKVLKLVDLPGFGFAKLSQSQKGLISELLKDYLTQREHLKCVCLLNDCRRTPGEEEIAIRNFAFQREIPVIIVLTKADKLSKNELNKQTKIICNAYHLEATDVIITSNKQDGKAFWGRVLSAISFES